VALVDLVFRDPPATGQPVALVFNDQIEAPSLDVSITGAGFLPLLHGRAEIAGNVVRVAAAGSLPALQGSASVTYRSDTQRPTVGGVVDHFQPGLAVDLVQRDRAQAAGRARAVLQDHAQAAHALRLAEVLRWQQAQALRVALAGRFQQGLARRRAVADRFQEAVRQRVAIADHYAEALDRRAGVVARFQEALKRRADVLDHALAAQRSGLWIVAPAQRGRPARWSWLDRYQDAIRPRPGQWLRPPIVVPEACYVPGTELVFEVPWSASTELVFVCERHGTGPVDPTDPTEPGALVVVPILRSYLVFNSASLRRVDDLAQIPVTSMTLALDADSWTWSFSARVPGSALAQLEPSGSSGPVEVEAQINGVPYRFLVEGLSRDRSFGRSDLAVTGRGRSALLDAPYVPSMIFRNAAARTAQQLAADVLSVNGVPLGWDLDWRPEDWLIPAGTWSHQGTYVSALNAIASAAGGYLQPHRTAQQLAVLLRYPAKPWEWDTVSPDYELPADVVSREAIQWRDLPLYNRVFVAGGVLGVATRAGTAGDVEAPMVTDALITTAAAARQRALPVLANVGRQAEVSLRLPVLAETGIIPPGKFVRYVDAGKPRIGLVRSTSASVEQSADALTIWQTIGVETRVPV
jgi:hypothetical protein